MIRYYGILEKEPGTLWGIWFPDLPGCVTAADTAEQALAQAPEALRLWIEDAARCAEALPSARTIEQLRDDPDVADGLRKGDATVLVTLRAEEDAFDSETLATIDAAAARRGVTRLDFVRAAVLEKIAS